MSAPRQDEFGGGIFRSPRAPAGCVYDCVDGLVDDELAIYRRGGGAYQSTGAPGALRGLADGQLAAGNRTVLWTADRLQVLDPADDLTPVDVTGLLSTSQVPRAWARAFGMNGVLAFKTVASKQALLYGGATKAAYSTGTLSATTGSTTVSGSGTSWLTAVEPGTILFIGATPLGVVAKVNSNTSLDLADNSLVTAAGSAYLARAWDVMPLPATPEAGTSHVATVGSPPRLVITVGSRAYFSESGQWWTMLNTNYHEVPPPGEIVGADGMRDVLVLFATSGVWIVRNMSLDLTDASGNPQQQLQQLSKDIILWDDNGVAGLSTATYTGVLGWEGQMIVPALDDVYVVGIDSPAMPISRGIRSQYRAYVAAGHHLGTATLYRGHYILPILDVAQQPVDCFVCRLDLRDSRGQLRPAWTRWSGFAFGGGYAGRVRSGSPPRLLGTKATRLTNLTGVFAPGAANKQDADGTTHVLDVIENDVELANRSTTTKVDLLYELQDAAADNPTITGSWAAGAEGASWTGLSGSAAENDGRVPKRWKLTKRVRNVRFRWQTVGPAAVARIRGRVLYVRDSNRP